MRLASLSQVSRQGEGELPAEGASRVGGVERGQRSKAHLPTAVLTRQAWNGAGHWQVCALGRWKEADFFKKP